MINGYVTNQSEIVFRVYGRPSNVSLVITNQLSSQADGAFGFQLIYETLFITIDIQKRRQRWSILILLKMSVCPRLSLGWCKITDEWRWGVEALVEAALSIGINTLTLRSGYLWRWPVWGPAGGVILKRRPIFRDQMWIQSAGFCKDGFTYFDFSKDYIFDSTMRYPRAFQIERLDSLLLHRPDALMEPKKWRQLLIAWSKGKRPAGFGCPIKSHDDGSPVQTAVKQPPQGRSSCSWVPPLHLALKPVFMSTWKGQKQPKEMAVSLSIVA